MTDNPLESLTARIKGTAYNIARRYGGSPEDVEQDLIVLLLEQYVEDPDFLNDPVSAVNYAASRVGWQTRKEMIHAARIGNEDLELESGQTIIGTFYGMNPWPAVERTLVVEQALQGMDERDQAICEMLAEGYTAREIAPKVNCSYRTIYNRMDAIAGALQ